MAILENTNSHAVRMTGKVAGTTTVWNIPPFTKIDVQGRPGGAPPGVRVINKVTKKPVEKKPEAEKVIVQKSVFPKSKTDN